MGHHHLHRTREDNITIGLNCPLNCHVDLLRSTGDRHIAIRFDNVFRADLLDRLHGRHVVRDLRMFFRLESFVDLLVHVLAFFGLNGQDVCLNPHGINGLKFAICNSEVTICLHLTNWSGPVMQCGRSIDLHRNCLITVFICLCFSKGPYRKE